MCKFAVKKLEGCWAIIAVDATVARMDAREQARAERDAEIRREVKAEVAGIDMDAVAPAIRAPAEPGSARQAAEGGRMTTLSDVMKAVRDVVVMNERVAQLTSRVDRLDTSNTELPDRVTRMEAFFEVIRPVILQQALPPPRE